MLTWLHRIFRRRETAPDAAAARGAAGERLAAEVLRRRHGYRIVARNWRNPGNRRDEIDLVCRDRDVLVFVEVKTRPADALVRGFLAVDRRKQRALRRAIRAYLRLLRRRPATYRLDVVEVTTDGTAPPEVLLLQNVPLFRRARRGPG